MEVLNVVVTVLTSHDNENVGTPPFHTVFVKAMVIIVLHERDALLFGIFFYQKQNSIG